MIHFQEIITDIELLSARTIYRDGFAFTSLSNIGNSANVFDAIIIRNPLDAPCFTPKLGKSSRSLQEHIDFINFHALEKAVVIAENINFLVDCPTLKYLQIVPADHSCSFDYSPLYNLPHIYGLNCATEFGIHLTQKTNIDYSHFHHLLDLDATGTGQLNFSHLSTLKRLNATRLPLKNLAGNMFNHALKDLRITQCQIKSLNGISQYTQLTGLSLWHNRSLSDIGEIGQCSSSLKSLSIGACSKISDWSFLSQLNNLEFLELKGNNSIPSLAFLSAMKNLKCFVFDLNVIDGNLTPCFSVPCVHLLRNRKHYNFLDADLPKQR